VADIEGGKNLFCFSPLISNDAKKVAIKTNSGIEYIYHLNGDGKINENSMGISLDWSDDNIRIITFLDLDFGEHYTVESDLYIYNSETNQNCKLMDTKDVLEIWPSWSKDKISYIDDKTNIVYVADLKSEN
jgi:hypothetical protein